jgi:hypothetical protein
MSGRHLRLRLILKLDREGSFAPHSGRPINRPAFPKAVVRSAAADWRNWGESCRSALGQPDGVSGRLFMKLATAATRPRAVVQSTFRDSEKQSFAERPLTSGVGGKP